MYVSPVFTTPYAATQEEFLHNEKLMESRYLCNCNQPAKATDKPTDGYYVCQTELSEAVKKQVYTIFLKYFYKSAVGSEEFLNEMKNLTGRVLEIRDVEKNNVYKNPLSFLFYFTTTKCHSEVNWKDIFSFRSDRDENLIENISKIYYLKGNICFSDSHLIFKKHNHSNYYSILIREGENTSMLKNLKQSFTKYVEDFKKNYPNQKIEEVGKEFHGKKLFAWKSLLEDLNKKLTEQNGVLMVSKPSNFISRIRAKNEKTEKNEIDTDVLITEIVNVNMCGEHINAVNLTVSDLPENFEFFGKVIDLITPPKKSKRTTLDNASETKKSLPPKKKFKKSSETTSNLSQPISPIPITILDDDFDDDSLPSLTEICGQSQMENDLDINE